MNEVKIDENYEAIWNFTEVLGKLHLMELNEFHFLDEFDEKLFDILKGM